MDLPDVDKADLAEQGEEEYCENCGRPMVLKKGRFGTFFACTGYPGLQDHQADRRHAEESRTSRWTKSARSAATTWC